jgi:hypothetical protein
MSLEDEVVLADIEVAGRLLTDSIARDSRFALYDLQDVVDAARFSSHLYSTPPKEVRLLASCQKLHFVQNFHSNVGSRRRRTRGRREFGTKLRSDSVSFSVKERQNLPLFLGLRFRGIW